MVKKIILFILPLILLIEILIFNFIVELLRQPSDMSVFAGIVFICVTLISNFFLFKFIIKQVKK